MEQLVAEEAILTAKIMQVRHYMETSIKAQVRGYYKKSNNGIVSS